MTDQTRTLYHLPLSASCRAARLALAEKGLPFDLVAEATWERRDEFLALNPAGEVPVLVDVTGTAVAGPLVVLEYLEEAYPDPPLMANEVAGRAECRRLVDWFNRVFANQAGDVLVHERIAKRYFRMGQPDSKVIRSAHDRLAEHMDYIGSLAETRRWLAGDEMSLADLVAAAHLSVVDFLGDVPWTRSEAAHDWYAKIKSRPSFRPLLMDQVPGTRPPPHYADLDF